MSIMQIVATRAAGCAAIAAFALLISNPFFESRNRLLAMYALATVAAVLFCLEPLL